MSLISHPAPSRVRWPWLMFAAGFIGLALLCWHYWPQLLLQSVIWQKQLHQQMTTLLQQAAAHPAQAGGALLGFSFIYGVLHAAGPGHGKVVIATFLATHPTQLKTSIRLTLLAALMQGLMAIALVTLLLVVLQLSSRQLHLSSYWLEKSSFLLVALLGVWLCWRNGKTLWRALKPRPRILQLHAIDHAHHANCGCGHQHVPDSQKLASVVGWKTELLLVLSMGFRPCSGALMMLLFAKVMGVYYWGVLSALVMAAGTALTVTAMALLVQSARALAVKINCQPARHAGIGLPLLALSGGLLLVLAGCLLWFSAEPALSGGLRPLFQR